ncbi:hypothetical protein EYC84_009724 [Monilinia fructicola]|uniref:Uncharacterized protein n=1 Tax=Monilinia fructicola TaxID=38448 RepID=A0A5M9JC14_MONFR|nr:hypothetical protein EYC84_009724 [Monilinia fructicola]
MTRKRLDIRESVDRNVKRHRTLRIWISNTVEDQPWQSDNTLDVDAFDFSTNMDSSFRVRIEGRLLDDDEEDSEDSEDEDETAEDGADAMDVDKKKKTKKCGVEETQCCPECQWSSAAADFDQLEFKRSGDENCNIVINLVRDETPERFQLSPVLSAILDTNVGTREEVTMAFSQVEKKDTGPNSVMPSYPTQQSFSHQPSTTSKSQSKTPSKPPLKLPPKNPTYATNLLELSSLDKQLAVIVRAIANSKSKHSFFDALSKNPTEFIRKWISSQKRDLEMIAGDGMRGGGEDATSDEWRRGVRMAFGEVIM